MSDDPVGPPTAGEDPLAADRRTLTIGAISVVVLVLIGVVSAQLFARGNCVAVPEPGTWTGPSGAVDELAPEQRVEEVLGSVDGARAVDIVEQVAGASVVSALPVGEASGVAPLAGGLVVTGDQVVTLDSSLAPVATVATDEVVVGGGRAVHHLAVSNLATGQADAFVPMVGTSLEVGTCVDTTVIGSPFAFLLDAADGELLLLRAEEDGDRPELQLRAPDGATRWEARLTLPEGPPGTLAERLSARLGPDAVVATRRVSPQEGDTGTALTVVDRSDGTVTLEVDSAELTAATELDLDVPIRWEVGAVGTTTALLHARPDPAEAPDTVDGEAPTDAILALLDLTDGRILSSVEGVGALHHAAATVDVAGDDRYVVATASAGGTREQITFAGPEDGWISLGDPLGGARFAWVGEEVLVAASDSLSRVRGDGTPPTIQILPGARFVDVVVTDDGRVATLVAPRDGGEAVLLVTEADATVAGGS